MTTNVQLGLRPLVIVGSGVMLDECASAWPAAQPERKIEVLRLESPDKFNFDISPVARFDGDDWAFFAAVGSDGINFTRLKLMTDLRLLGCKLDRFVSPRAMVSPDLSVGENCFIADGAVIGVGVSMRHNCWFRPRAIIGPGAKLGHSVWVGPGAILGQGVSVGDNTTIGTGAILAEGMEVGRQCELLIAQEYRGVVPDRTYFSALFQNPVRIYGRVSPKNK